MVKLIAVAAALSSLPIAALAGEADVLEVKTRQVDADTWRFDVTVRHDDEGWDHFADRWEVLDPDGEILGRRVLAHPHVEEQPFTRSAEIRIPADVTEVIVRAHDTVDGYGGREVKIVLDR